MSSTFQVRARVVPYVVPRHQHAFLTPLLLPPAVQNIFLLPRVVYIEHQIINIFLEANTDELNLIVMSVELALILYKVAPSPAPTHPHSLAEPSTPLLCPLAHQVKDHRLSRQLNRTKLLQTLAVDRLGELNVSSRAMLLDAIQVRVLSTHPAPTYSNPYLAPI
jgi:hypothetical protein